MFLSDSPRVSPKSYCASLQPRTWLGFLCSFSVSPVCRFFLCMIPPTSPWLFGYSVIHKPVTCGLGSAFTQKHHKLTNLSLHIPFSRIHSPPLSPSIGHSSEPSNRCVCVLEYYFPDFIIFCEWVSLTNIFHCYSVHLSIMQKCGLLLKGKKRYLSTLGMLAPQSFPLPVPPAWNFLPPDSLIASSLLFSDVCSKLYS